LYTVLFAAIDH
jgi:hypothetical protein